MGNLYRQLWKDEEVVHGGDSSFLSGVVEGGASGDLKGECVSAVSGGGSDIKQTRQSSVPRPRINNGNCVSAHHWDAVGVCSRFGVLGVNLLYQTVGFFPVT